MDIIPQINLTEYCINLFKEVYNSKFYLLAFSSINGGYIINPHLEWMYIYSFNNLEDLLEHLEWKKYDNVQHS